LLLLQVQFMLSLTEQDPAHEILFVFTVHHHGGGGGGRCFVTTTMSGAIGRSLLLLLTPLTDKTLILKVKLTLMRLDESFSGYWYCLDSRRGGEHLIGLDATKSHGSGL